MRDCLPSVHNCNRNQNSFIRFPNFENDDDNNNNNNNKWKERGKEEGQEEEGAGEGKRRGRGRRSMGVTGWFYLWCNIYIFFITSNVHIKRHQVLISFNRASNGTIDRMLSIWWGSDLIRFDLIESDGVMCGVARGMVEIFIKFLLIEINSMVSP